MDITTIDLTKIWNSSYLFGPNPIEFSRSDNLFFWTGIGLVVIALAAKVFSLRMSDGSPKKNLLRRVFNLFCTCGILILLWAGARYENIPWLSTHFVVFIVFIFFFIRLLLIARYSIWKLEGEQKLWKDEELKRKYLVK